MTVADVSIIVLVALFVATALPSFNLGLSALAAAFVLALVAGVPTETLTGFFPADFFVLIVGVTALFAVAKINGTLDWLLDLLLRLARGRVVLVALVPFVIGAVLTAVGTLPAAATAIVSPIALGLSARHRIAALVAAVLGITGIISGLLSPLAVYGVTARELGEKQGMDLPASAPGLFLLGGLLAGIVIAAVLVVVGLRIGAIPRGRVSTTADESSVEAFTSSGAGHDGWARAFTVICLIAVVVLSVGFDMNIGYLGITAAALQLVVLRLDAGALVATIPWGIVLLIGGLLTYVGLMQELGAFTRISDLLRVEGAPLLSLLVLCYIAGITSFAASSIAVFVTTLPLLPPLVAEGVSPVGGVLALALASVLVDINPLGITGGLILGAAEEKERPALFRQMLGYGVVSVAVAPAIAWAAFSWW